jgi:hypothetical protein
MHGGAQTPGGLTLGFPSPWPGEIRAILTEEGCPGPTGFQILPMGASDTQSTGGYWMIDADPPSGLPAGMELCLHYPQPPAVPGDPATYEGGLIEQNLRIQHGSTDTATSDPDVCASASWTALTPSRPIDMVNNIICGYTDTLSPFVVVKPLPGLTFSGVPGTIVAYAASTRGARISYTAPTAVDAAGFPRAVTCARPPGSWFAPGKTTVTCWAVDAVGKTGTSTFTVWVKYQAPEDGTFFLPPIRPDGSAIFRINPPVPVRFKLTGASAGITNLCAKLIVTKISNAVQGTIVVARDNDGHGHDADFFFKYKSGKKLYEYRWKTHGESPGSYRLRADLGDDVVHEVDVSLR